MLSKTQQGKLMEERAQCYLEQHGLQLVTHNYRTRRGEIDLIMRDGAVLVFVEVRYRRTPHYGGAAESITIRKQQRLLYAARCFLARYADEPICRFDVVTVEGDSHQQHLCWLRDVLSIEF